jgi:hypothetical protein
MSPAHWRRLRGLLGGLEDLIPVIDTLDAPEASDAATVLLAVTVSVANRDGHRLRQLAAFATGRSMDDTHVMRAPVGVPSVIWIEHQDPPPPPPKRR